MFHLNNLEFLHLSGNQLSELVPIINNLSNLISLNVDNNLLTTLSPEILELNDLKYFYFANMHSIFYDPPRSTLAFESFPTDFRFGQ